MNAALHDIGCRYPVRCTCGVSYLNALPITTLTHSKIETGPLERETDVEPMTDITWSPGQHNRRAS